jgi:error-prone DNA polymerase
MDGPSGGEYAELHAHSAYSFLDGASLPEELVMRAVELGYGTLALTDHDSVAGAMEFSTAAHRLGLRPIVGAEITVIDPAFNGGEAHHLTLLVRSGVGWSRLCRLLTRAHAHTRDRSDRSAGQPSVTLQDVQEHADGLVCLSGCSRHGVRDYSALQRLRDAFSPENLKVELQRPYARHDRAHNRMLTRLAERLDVRILATGNVHAHTPTRALLQDALVAVRHGRSLDDTETLRRPNHSHVLARPEAMRARFKEHPGAMAETARLCSQIEFDLTEDLGYRYPGVENRDAIEVLAEVCSTRFAARYPRGARFHEEAASRLERELALIDELGLAGFFVLHHEVLELAREVAAEVRGPDTARGLLPPGRGRGSSVSSIVCYLTGLSHIDPVANDLTIGRFLHADIESLPDIDIDFPRDIRAKLIPRVHEHYGATHSALVAAFPTYRSRGAIRDLGKALGLPASDIERVARGSEGYGSSGSVAGDIASALGKGALSGRWAWLARLADEAYGLPRHISQHPGGMVISTQPLIDCCPVLPAAMEGRQMVMWDKDSCSDARFLKIDLLGLGMLSAVERCVEMIAERVGERIDLSRIPFDDEPTFSAIGAADTVGVFQIESRAQIGSLYRTQPKTLEDLTIQVALVRPGPIVGGAVNPYIERRQALLRDRDYQIPYLHPSLEEVLKETLGTIIFQDQVIEVARAFAGFSSGKAEGLRRAMSRKRSREAMDGHRQEFLDGAMRTHEDVRPPLAEQVWEMVAGFAGFGFPKAHGAAFGLLAYQSTWLRVHYPAEFLCALLNEQPMGFYPPDSLIHEAQRRNLTILSPQINRSYGECTVTPEAHIQIGLAYIKGIHAQDIAMLIHSRERSGRYQTLEDLAARGGVSRKVLELLAWSGACDELTGAESRHARRKALWQLGVTEPAKQVKEGLQLALELPLAKSPQLEALDDWESMIADYATTHLSVERHPLALLRKQLEDRAAISTADLSEKAHGSRITIGGLVIARQRPGTANGITFLLIEDEAGTLNVIVPPALYEAQRLTVRTEPLIVIEGILERHPQGGGAINLLAKTIGPLARRIDGQAPARNLHDSQEPADEAADEFVAVAPPSMNFAQGRRR